MVESPVVYFIYKRHNVIRQVLTVLQEAKPKIMYVISDAGNTEIDIEAISQSRSIVNEMVNWHCKLEFIKLDENLGPYRIWNYAVDLIFKTHDRAIILEEDILPSLDYFRFMDEVLEKYKDDSHVYFISGMNFLGKYPVNQEVSYFFVNSATTWGMATWKRTYEKFIRNFSDLDTPYYNQVILSYLDRIGGAGWFGHLKLAQSKELTHNNSMEFYLMGINDNLLYNSLAIVPASNLVRNIGNTSDSENSDDSKILPKSMRKVFEIPIEKMEFPLVHPKFKITDYHYGNLLKRKRGFWKSKFPVVIKLDRALRILYFKGPRVFVIKTKRAIKRYMNYDGKKKLAIRSYKRKLKK
jgi:hypothetical protein